MRRRVWIGLLIVTGVLLAGWHFRQPIIGVVRIMALPNVEPPPAGVIRFAVIGDYGAGSTQERDVANMINSWKPGFIATVGDNNLPKGSVDTIDQNIGRFYHAYISPYKGNYGQGAAINRFFPIPGHRDWDSQSLRPYLDYFTLPGNGRYYDLVRGPVHLFSSIPMSASRMGPRKPRSRAVG